MRPDPDALLASEQRASRARLKIFFGASPGVGKTYAMLEAARREPSAIVGIVETHGRDETAALLDGMTVLPRRVVEHRGVPLDELDLEAVLAAHPALVLVDELAHTNAPGSRHVKRWQDVLELLDAGIDVWTTLNVQHVESLGDVVQQITGVKVRETVPDAVLDRADELELVDLPPDELLARLAAGKVYVPDQIERASGNFFTRGNLMSLRELALRRTAERVDADVLAYRREHGIVATWPTRERIVVCVGPSPGSERLIRAAKRMAEGLRAPWASVHVDVLGAPPLAARDRERIEGHLRLVEALGGEVVRLRGASVARAVLDHAHAHNATRIVAGKPTHGRWRRSMVDALIRGSGAIEIHVIAPLAEAAPPGPREREPAPAGGYLIAIAAVALVTGLGLAAQDYVTVADAAMLYLIAIMGTALRGRGPSLLAASLAVAAFDLCFVPPRFTFAVTDARYLLTFAVMFGSGLAVSTLTVRLRREERDAAEREQRTAALLAFTREVGAAASSADVAIALARRLEESLDVAAAVLLPEGAELVAAAGLMPLAAQEASVARWAYDHRAVAGHGTDTLPGARALCIPLLAGNAAFGVLALQRRPGSPPKLTVDQRGLVDAMARQAGVAIARGELAVQARDAAVKIRTEELRSSLLSAVSHDLRTPLAVITGAATTLRDTVLGPEERDALLSSIVDDATRLERVLANLLQLTRVETGLQPTREWVPADEVVGAALTRLEGAIGDRAVEVDVDPEAQLHVDPVLFEQVVINLIENALKHGAPPLLVRARKGELAIGDRGAGLTGDPARLFEKFVRASTAPGAGLGLAVVRAIVEAHGGTVTGENRPGGGALFTVKL